MTYIKNNIEFRMLVASYYAEFFRTKAFMLGQVLSDNKHRFNAAPKEVLLLYYKEWFSWLENTEVLFLKNVGSTITTDTRNAVIDSIGEKVRLTQEVSQSNPDIFDPRFMEIWNDVALSHGIKLESRVRELLHGSLAVSFEHIMDLTNKLFNHILFNLYEMDFLIYHESEKEYPFINIDIVDVNLMLEHKYCSPSNRVACWQKHGIMQHDRVVVINNLDAEYLDEDQERADAFERILSNIELCGIEIIGIM